MEEQQQAKGVFSFRPTLTAVRLRRDDATATDFNAPRVIQQSVVNSFETDIFPGKKTFLQPSGVRPAVSEGGQMRWQRSVTGALVPRLFPSSFQIMSPVSNVSHSDGQWWCRTSSQPQSVTVTALHANPALVQPFVSSFPTVAWKVDMPDTVAYPCYNPCRETGTLVERD
jgi:hypothetical protein